MFDQPLWQQLQQLFTPNTWHHVQFTVAPSGGSIVTSLTLDGQLIGTETVSVPFTSDDWTLHVGDFSGDIDEVRISRPATP